MKEARYKEYNIIISDSTLYKILPPQLNNMTSQYKAMCGCECCISSKSMHLSLLKWIDRPIKHINDRIHNAKIRRSSELSSRLFETYKMLYDLMDVIFKIMLQIWLRQKCFPVSHNIMGYHTGNVYYAVVRNSPVFVYLVRRQINMQQKRGQQ